MRILQPASSSDDPTIRFSPLLEDIVMDGSMKSLLVVIDYRLSLTIGQLYVYDILEADRVG